MVEPKQTTDNEFSAQLQALIMEAEQERGSPPPVLTPEPEPPSGSYAGSSMEFILRPIVEGIEALTRSQAEQLAALGKLDGFIAATECVPKMLADTRQALENRNTVSKAMFEALHTELKTYKDAFILESVLRPVIRDLISVYDDIAEIHRQLTATVSTFDEEENGEAAMILLAKMRHAGTNLDHNAHFILEVLERLDVSLGPISSGKLDKRTQKAVSVEPTENPEEDNDIVRILKRGFQWKDRVIRAEEVVINKWKPAPAASAREPEETSTPAAEV